MQVLNGSSKATGLLVLKIS